MSMTRSTPPREKSLTPWGSADFVEVLTPGIVSVSTPSHGGIWLAPHLNAEIHPVWRSDDGWYEEDCEANIVLLAFPGALGTDLDPAPILTRLHDSLAYSFTRQHAVAYPAEAKAREGRATFDSNMAALRQRETQQT
jgi:hypothetical protein